MKLFRNRGDFYIPKSGKGSSKETKILFSLLIVIVVFTAVFVIALSSKYHSAAEFFGKGEVSVTSGIRYKEKILPKISGKTNYLIIETDDKDKTVHYMFLLQADKDNKAYKAAVISPETLIDTENAQKIYATGGGAALQKKLTEYMGFEIDHYAVFDTSSFVEFTGKLGSFVYNVNSDIRYSGGGEDDKYTIHLNEGEQKISGRDITNLLRYYCSETKDYYSASELVLKTVTSLFNAENYEKSESLFRLFIKSAKTDITVRDFENGKNGVYVFCTESNDITIYTVKAEYDENCVLTQNAAKEIKGYFGK